MENRPPRFRYCRWRPPITDRRTLLGGHLPFVRQDPRSPKNQSPKRWPYRLRRRLKRGVCPLPASCRGNSQQSDGYAILAQQGAGNRHQSWHHISVVARGKPSAIPVKRRIFKCLHHHARMAKSADAADLKSAGRKAVGVQVPLRAPDKLL